MFHADSIDFDAALKHKTLVNGRNVFGGGGVMPDIFIPMDTSRHYAYMNNLRRKRITLDFVLDFVDTNRDKVLKKYPEFDAFNKKFEITEEHLADVIARGEKAGIEKDEEGLAFTRDNLKRELKAYIARDIYSLNDMFKILYSDDDAIKKALEVIEDQKEYENLLVVTQFEAK